MRGLKPSFFIYFNNLKFLILMEQENNLNQSDSNNVNESTGASKTVTSTTCCPCDVCTCGENCTCSKGTISCDPCAQFVEECKRKNSK
jgi:hypothetical protein